MENIEKISTWKFFNLTGKHFFVVSALIFADISSTYNPLKFSLSVIIFLIRLLRSNSAKVSFSNTLLISGKIFPFTVKISNALCRPGILALTSLKPSVKTDIIRKDFPARIFAHPQDTRVWSKINYGDASTSSKTFNYILCIFSGKTFFLSN